MPRLNQVFDATTVDTSDPRDPLEPGWYYGKVIETSYGPNQKGTGELAKVTIEVTRGPRAGKYMWDNFNLVHDNPVAVQIAHKQFAQLSKALGLKQVSDTDELVNGRELQFLVGMNKAGDREEVKKYKAVEEPQPSVNAPPQEPPTGAAHSGANVFATAASESKDDIPF